MSISVSASAGSTPRGGETNNGHRRLSTAIVPATKAPTIGTNAPRKTSTSSLYFGELIA